MKQTLIFMVTNGSGLGHLTRGLAVAKRLRKVAPQLEIVFFSTSLGLDMIRNEGFMFYYIPTQKLMPIKMNATNWNNYLYRHLQELITIYDPIGIVFDGAYPYGGVIANLKQYEMLKCIWIKREGYKENTSYMYGLENLFGLVIVPKELDNNRQEKENIRKKFCNPILLLDKEEAHEREVVRQALGVHKRESLIYVQLGAGNINPIEQQLNVIIECLLENTKNQILIGESPIGKPLYFHNPRIKTVRQYPNSQYFKGVDLAVSAAGYNTFNELTYFNIPTLYIPNTQTLKDSQVARAKLAENKGIGVYVEEVNKKVIQEALQILYTRQGEFRQTASKLIRDNGAYEAAHYIIQYLKYEE